MNDTFLARAAETAGRRRNPDPDITEARNVYLEEQTDWRGTCQYCKKTLTGTMAALQGHTCPEFEASNESSS